MIVFSLATLASVTSATSASASASIASALATSASASATSATSAAVVFMGILPANIASLLIMVVNFYVLLIIIWAIFS
jgi:hypothetical protein